MQGDIMNKLIVAVGALAGLAAMTSARAADLSLKAPPAPPPAPVMSWSGCYIAGGVGYGMFNEDHFGETVPGNLALTSSATAGGRGWLGRLGGGCDYQIGSNFVIGFLGDYDFANIHGTSDVSGIAGDQNMSAAWAIGGRLGYLPYQNLMVFVSGGWTEARFDQSSQFTTFAPIGGATGVFLPEHTYDGWFIGSGFEYQVPWHIINGLFWRTEYRYSQYSSADLPFTFTGGGTTGTGVHMEKFTQSVTTSLIWKFDWFGHY
jgi:outer membrane immunogenic protein